MYKFFVSINEVDSRKKSIQSDLALEKYWVTKCGWLRLCMTVAMGMTIKDLWELFHYGVKIDYYGKLIGFREFL